MSDAGDSRVSGDSRVYVVTGSASGIGREVTGRLRDQGHRVVGVDVHDADVVGDLGDPAGRAEIVRGVESAVAGAVDGLITCAGVRDIGPQTVAVNFFGTVDIIDALHPRLLLSAAPRVVALSSLAAVLPIDPEVVNACLARDEPTALANARVAPPTIDGRPRLYYSSKHALSRWVRQNAATPKWGGAGILMSAVAPGTVRTPMTVDVTADAATERAWLDRLPNVADRLLDAAEIAELALWLCSPANTVILGQTLFADLGSEVLIRGDRQP